MFSFVLSLYVHILDNVLTGSLIRVMGCEGSGAVVGVVLMRTCFELRERGKLGCIEHGTLAPCTKSQGLGTCFSQYIRYVSAVTK